MSQSHRVRAGLREQLSHKLLVPMLHKVYTPKLLLVSFLFGLLISLSTPASIYASAELIHDFGINPNTKRNIVRSILVNPDNAQELLLSAETGTVLSTDGGFTFDEGTGFPPNRTIKHKDNFTVTSFGQNFIFSESFSRNTAWQVVTSTPYDFEMNPHNKYEIVWAQNSSNCFPSVCGVFKAVYNTTTQKLEQQTQLLTSQLPVDIAYGSDGIYRTDQRFIYKHQEARTWQTIDTHTQVLQAGERIMQLLITDLDVKYLIVLKEDVQPTQLRIYEHTDVWNDVSPSSVVNGIGHINPFTHEIYITSEDKGILRLAKDSKEWVTIIDDPTQMNEHITTLGFSHDGTLYAGSFTGKVFRFGLTNQPPQHRPVIFIHGWGGHPSDWITGNKQAYWTTLQSLGYPEAYLRSYAYADADGNPETYDYQGDITKIAAHVHDWVNELSFIHQADGGDGKVDLVGFSLGGLVIRQFIHEYPNTDQLRQVITIGSPHLGADILSPAHWLSSIPVLGNFLEKALRTSVDNAIFDLTINRSSDHPLSLLSDAAQQFTPGSNFLNTINTAHVTTQSYDFHTLCGSIDLGIKQKILFFNLNTHINLGDILISENNTTNIPNYNTKKFCASDTYFTEAYIINVDENEVPYALMIDMPQLSEASLFHTNVVNHPDIRQYVITKLSSL